MDLNYIATFQMDSASVLILDIRVPAVPVAELTGHVGAVNSIGWAPHSSGHLCSVGTFLIHQSHPLIFYLKRLNPLKCKLWW